VTSLRAPEVPAALENKPRLGLAWLAFPLAWVTYTLVCGARLDWYPYPFLDVSELGYGGAFLRCALLAAGMAAGGLAVVLLGNGFRALRGRTRAI
jgi:hypothetical protein